MKTEKEFVDFITDTPLASIPEAPVHTIKNVILTVLGTTLAGCLSEGCREIVDYYRNLGGKGEATVLFHGGMMPAENAACVNGVMARALDFCDAMAPGVHLGSSIVPTAIAAAEVSGGCSGKEFLTALILGAELSSRLNLTESAYDGFDPTGVCTSFAATATAGRIIGLEKDQMQNALALAFNRCGGSFQSNIDGSLAVRVIQGWVAQNALTCVRLAQAGITGPVNFLEGVYGYFHLFGRDKVDAERMAGDLGQRFELQNIVFKKYPSCGLTQGCTEVILGIIGEENLKAAEVAEIRVHVPPYAHKLVGHTFQLGRNPRVNAQFSIQYCVASALLRGRSRLRDFEESSVKAPDVLAFLEKIHVVPDEQLDQRGHTALDMVVVKTDGAQIVRKLDTAPGFPGNPLSRQEHLGHWQDCLESSSSELSMEKAEKIPELVEHIEDMEDVRTLIPHLLK